MIYERKYEGLITEKRLPIPIIIPKELNGKTIKEVLVNLTSLPGGQSIKLDIRKNGYETTNTIFDTNVFEISTSETKTNNVYQIGCDKDGNTIGDSNTKLDSTKTSVSSNDSLTIFITQVGSTTPGANLNIQVVIE